MWQIQFDASLYLVTNELGLVIAWKIVPNDTREHVTQLIRDYYGSSPIKIPPRVFYTDDVAADKNSLKELMDDLIPEDDFDVIQDIWHAQQRIIRLLARQHPDHYSAVTTFKNIFSRILSGQYETVEDIHQAFEDWETKYQTVQKCYPQTEDAMIYLGIVVLILHFEFFL